MLLHYLVVTVKLHRTFRLDSWKSATLKQRANAAKAAYRMDTRYGWADLFYSPYRVQQAKENE